MVSPCTAAAASPQCHDLMVMITSWSSRLQLRWRWRQLLLLLLTPVLTYALVNKYIMTC